MHRRFSRWCHAGVWERVFEALTAERDNQYLMIDSTIVRARSQAATGRRGGTDQALGRSRGELTIAGMNAKAVIPSKRNRKVAIPHDAGIYKHRNQIERCFGRLKHVRRIATRYDRRTVHSTGFVHLACAMIWLR